jgi:hypothetical protein
LIRTAGYSIFSQSSSTEVVKYAEQLEEEIYDVSEQNEASEEPVIFL